MIETCPIGRLLVWSIRCSSAALVLSLGLAGQALAGIGGVGGVAPFPSFEQPRICPAGKPALSPERVRSILKHRGYYAIRGLRYLKPQLGEWVAPVFVGGRYVATASRGFGIVRWQLSVDPCTAQVAVARDAQTRTH